VVQVNLNSEDLFYPSENNSFGDDDALCLQALSDLDYWDGIYDPCYYEYRLIGQQLNTYTFFTYAIILFLIFYYIGEKLNLYSRNWLIVKKDSGIFSV
jgi:hypothetical protein